MLLKSSAIAIKTVKYAESSLIVRLYTQSHGLLSFYVKGAYSPKSAFKPSFFIPLQVLEIDFYYRENKNLLSLKEIKAEKSFSNNVFEKDKSPIALMMTELILKTVKEEEKNVVLYDFLISSIQILTNTKLKTSNFFLFFMVHLTKYLGFAPLNNFSVQNQLFDIQSGGFLPAESESAFSLNAEDSYLLNQLINIPMNDFSEIKITIHQRHNLLEKMLMYYEIHIDGFNRLNSLQVFREIFKNG